MSLFVPEDEDEKFVEVGKNEVDDADEVITEIPIYLSSKLNNLTVLQFPNRSKSIQIVSSKIKKESGLLELEVPLDTSKFFDSEKSSEWGNVQTQALSGVLKDNGIYYVGVLREGTITLTPLKSTVQLRPSLKYIDDASFNRRQKQQALNKAEDQRKSEVKVVQMTVKSTMESTQPRLGGALEASKKLEDEPFVNYNWKHTKSSEFLKKKLVHTGDDVILESDTTEKDYIDWLFSETKID